jgi:hypothetical protein
LAVFHRLNCQRGVTYVVISIVEGVHAFGFVLSGNACVVLFRPRAASMVPMRELLLRSELWPFVADMASRAPRPR